MKPPRPSVILTLASRTLNASEAGLLSLRVLLARGSHDAVELSLWSRTKLASASPGDTLAVQLGFEGEEEDVWRGEVTSVEHGERSLVIMGHAPTVALSRRHRSQTFLAQSVADIVRDLASAIEIDQVDADTDLAYYAVDHRRSVWGHLLDLAELSGSEITTSPSGGLRFLPVNALASTTRFRYGAELLSWRVGSTAQRSAPSFVAHGSASESGSEKWHWVNADPSAGAGKAQVSGAFHARALGEALSSTAASRARRAGVRGEIELVGQAELRAGAVFSLADLVSGDPGPLRALSVAHSVDGARGFRTLVRVEGASA
jgi:hypothetical protein